jgi:hypothetical protein
VKSTLLIVAATLLTFAIPFPANATLGGNITSVQADQTRLQGTLAATKTSAYTVEEIKAPTGVLVHEYLSTTGQVFAVTWKGRVGPNLQQVLGSYFQTYMQAAQAQKGRRIVRGPVTLKQGSLVVAMGGHMGWVVGKAYVTTMVPSNVQLEEIR